ncbi:hypothetical protein DPMN_147239 [Dreissena polymorpha]|uniref:Uncharacterized protein n=1 Tax=Dreissena polymorpha TaxID=45954 RepID=A0A9D4FBX1_DREPO|nr:hypothetical protein DPMN_147239 [Dreissena polymorpha]
MSHEGRRGLGTVQQVVEETGPIYPNLGLLCKKLIVLDFLSSLAIEAEAFPMR